MRKLLGQSGIIHTLPLLVIVAAVGIISYLLITSAAPFKGGLFGLLNPQPASKADSNIIDMAYPCGFTNPAFCDNFSEGPAPVKGRANDLDFRKWAFARVAGLGELNTWGQISSVEHCKQTITSGVSADADSFMCGSEVPEPEHWMETVDDHDSYVYNGARIRQPFDFTNRTGTIQYGVDAKNSGGHGWWLETWITDTPVQAPDAQTPGSDGLNSSLPRNGLGFGFTSGCDDKEPADWFLHGRGSVAVGFSTVVENYHSSVVKISNEQSSCATTQDDSSNMFQIRLSTSHVEIWASDHGSNVLKRIFSGDINPPLPFSKGYVNFNHVHYNPSKAGSGAAHYQTYHWHDMGFDGPVHPIPKVYEIPDSLQPQTVGADNNGNTAAVSIGYRVQPDGSITDGVKTFPSFTINNVDLAGSVNANLNMDLKGFYNVGDQLTYQFNNSPIRTFTLPAAVDYGPVLSFPAVIPVAVSDLQNGTNTLRFKTTAHPYWTVPNTVFVSSIDLELNPLDRVTQPAFAGTISCDLMNLMMPVMPGMQMVTDPCMNPQSPGTSPATPAAQMIISSPENGALLPLGTTSVTVLYTPNKNAPSGPASQARFQLDGKTVQTDSGFTGSFTFNGLGSGQHQLDGYLVDAASNKIPGSDTSTLFSILPLTIPLAMTGEYWKLPAPVDFNPATIPTTPPDLVRQDADINFDWNTGSPFTTEMDPNLNPQAFAARWTGNLNVTEAGNYNFHLNVNAGARVWVDNNLIIDKWKLSDNEANVILLLTTGTHSFKMEYFKFQGIANAKLYFSNDRISGLTPTPIPTPTPSQSPAQTSSPAPTPNPPTPPLVQVNSVDSSGSSVNVSYNSNVAAGDLLVAAIRLSSATAIGSVTDNNGNTWTLVDRKPNPATNDTLELWYAANTKVTPNNKPTIAISSSQSVLIRAIVEEYNNITSLNPLDQHQISTGNSSTLTVTSPVTTQANELVIGYGEVNNNSAFAVGGNYLLDSVVPTGTSAKLGIEHQIVSTSGSQTSTFSVLNQDWTMGIATFKLVGATCPKANMGDIDCDGSIGIFDFNLLVGNFGKTIPVNTQGDLDGDGKVGIFDFNIMVGNFGH